MQRIALVTGGAIAALVVIVGMFAFIQANEVRVSLTSDLQYRTRVLADSLQESIAPSLLAHATTSVQRIVEKIASNEHIAGIAVYDNAGELVARSGGLSSSVASTSLIAEAMDSAQASGAIMHGPDSLYVLADPIIDEQSHVTGALLVAQSALYIDTNVGQVWRDNLAHLLLLVLYLSITITVLVWWVFYHPLARLSQTLQAIRRGDTSLDAISGEGLLRPLAGEISKVTASLRAARFSASEEARLRLEKLDTPWTAERLKEFIKAYVKDRPIFVLSNREPYIHTKNRGKIEWHVPAGGVVTALDPVMEATGGVWIAHGSGTADVETADSEGKIKVPPEEPRYTLKRISLTEEEVKGYYDGFSNEALWPLCHMVHVRPVFRKEDWAQYRKVNGLFAKTLLEEIRQVERPLVLVQDYHLALVPALIKKSRPDAQVAMFWHIPWPSASHFSICPWRDEILDGMLGADLIGFHTQQYCNNFMDTVGNELESRIDLEHFSVFRGEHRTFVKAFPISIAFTGAKQQTRPPDHGVLEKLGIHTTHLLLGIDRLDYTKGILERFKGYELFLSEHPEYHGAITMLQIASPSRESVEMYRVYATAVEQETARINERFGARDWKPIVLERRNYSHAELLLLYRLASACLVTSLHDGMNLVSKEFVAARDDESGTLILSNFTGASRDLKDALIVNPYSGEEIASAIYAALTMPRTEQHRRMRSMRGAVRDYNVYRWSAEIIKTLAALD